MATGAKIKRWVLINIQIQGGLPEGQRFKDEAKDLTGKTVKISERSKVMPWGTSQ